MQIALDLFDCSNCGELLRSRQIHRGTDCRCPYCGKAQLIPGKRMGFFGKVANALFYAGDLKGMPESLCPHCYTFTPTFAHVCHRCCRDLPPWLVDVNSFEVEDGALTDARRFGLQPNVIVPAVGRDIFVMIA